MSPAFRTMKRLSIDPQYLRDTLVGLLEIPSPTGYTDRIVHHVGSELERLGISFELTRRGAIRARIRGATDQPSRAVVSHVDTLGAMVKNLKPNGRLEIVPIGFWSSRFAEGARVTIFRHGSEPRRGTILPLKASGHTYNEEVDTQPVAWSQVEVRTDDFCRSDEELLAAGYNIGDWIAVDTGTEVMDNGFVNSRHLDNKAGVTAMLGAAKAIMEAGVELPMDCHFLFTISEEVGTGASAVLHGDISEMVSVDNGTPAPGQNSRERGVTIAMKDETGPFDYHLTRKLLQICQEFGVEHQRDVFRYYRCDAASALEAGNDIRVALATFGADASHGNERTHLNAIQSVAELLVLYVQSDPTFFRDREALGPLEGFSTQPE